MPSNIQRTKGRAASYKFDRGGTPADPGPFIGTVKNNVDPTRMGRLEVYIEQFAGGNENDRSLWRTVSYLPPFYGSTYVPAQADTGPGGFTTNQQSYGMWFTPPDLGVSVICFFIEGDPNQGYYMGVIPDEGINHMVPAIGASRNFALEGAAQQTLLRSAQQLPVTEINAANTAIAQSPRFFDQEKPVHSVVAGIMFQQGLITDPLRGPITSNSQRESPSGVFGFSTPGRPVYQGGLNEQNILQRLEKEQVRLQDVQVIARRGGHSMVLDDGDLEGRDNLVRIRTSKGHQITMSDDGDFFYVIHANGQTWIELGKQGTVDVYSTNSVNIRTQGTINLHADRDINMYAGGSINMKSSIMKMRAESSMDLSAENNLTVYSQNFVGVRSDGTLAIKSVKGGGWDAGTTMLLKAGCIDINGGAAPPPVQPPEPLRNFQLADTAYNPDRGWQVEPGKLETITTRAPTHEPYPYHNQGVANAVAIGPTPTPPLTPQAQATLVRAAGARPVGTIDTATYVEQGAAAVTVGSLQPAQVTGLLAQSAAVANQPATAVTPAGVGKYAMSPQQLEAAGFLKPGTVQQYLSDPARLQSVLSSPTVWTGRDGVTNLQNLLNDVGLQDRAQQEIMVGSLAALQKTGVITGSESPADLAPFVQAASRFGVTNAIDWAKGQAPADLVTQMDGVAKGAQFAVNFVNEKLPPVLGSGARLGGFVDTVNRESLDQALNSIIGNAKVPLPDFGQGLYNNTPDKDLIYRGDDEIVWDRINAERLKRGLPGLADIGIPRPGTPTGSGVNI